MKKSEVTRCDYEGCSKDPTHAVDEEKFCFEHMLEVNRAAMDAADKAKDDRVAELEAKLAAVVGFLDNYKPPMAHAELGAAWLASQVRALIESREWVVK